MPMKETEIKELIKETFNDAQIVITDLKGDGDHYAIHVISSAFKDSARGMISSEGKFKSETVSGEICILAMC